MPSLASDEELARQLQARYIEEAFLARQSPPYPAGPHHFPDRAPPPPLRRSRTSEHPNPACYSCKQPCESRSNTVRLRGRHYHQGCFRCGHCNEPINATRGANCAIIDDKPYHATCTNFRYPICVVCSQRLTPSPGSHQLRWKHAPFWSEPFCTHHDKPDACRQCHRVLPPSKLFPLPDGRLTCTGCTSGTVLTTNDGVALLHGREAVPPETAGDATHIAFQAKGHRGTGAGISGWLERSLPLPKAVVWPPLMVVDEGVLNAQARAAGTGHTRGLTLWEESRAGVIVGFDGRGRPVVQSVKVPGGSAVTGMFLLSGLPKWQAVSVLAHEATHALLRLFKEPGAPKLAGPVEEGLCQLIAWGYLQSVKPMRRTPAPWPHRGREPAPQVYLDGIVDADGDVTEYGAWALAVWQIENDPSPTYGGSFRRCKAFYDRCSDVGTVFDYLRVNGALPEE